MERTPHPVLSLEPNASKHVSEAIQYRTLDRTDWAKSRLTEQMTSA
jgi:hypothetical protein